VQGRHTGLPNRRRSGLLNRHQTVNIYAAELLLVAKAVGAKNDNNGTASNRLIFGAGWPHFWCLCQYSANNAMYAANSFFGRLDNFVVDEIPSIERMWPKQLNFRGLDRWTIGMRSASSTGDGSF
jgi:hypothetical protein